MQEASQNWKSIRVALVVLSAPIWLFFRSEMQGELSTPPSWYFPLVLCGFTLFGVIFLSVLRPDKEWAAPSWHANPFDMTRPLEGLHASGWGSIAGALTLFVFGMLQAQTDWSWVLPGCFGAGLLAGIRVVSIPIHRRDT
jgi:hypothetical protein